MTDQPGIRLHDACLRVTVAGCDSSAVTVQCADNRMRRVPFLEGDMARAGYMPLLRPGITLNLLDAVDDGSSLMPRFIVVEPDYLVDVSLLAECCRSFGDLWQLYFCNRLLPHKVNRHILLGNAANLIFDELVNAEDPAACRLDAMFRKVFVASPLEFSVCPDVDNVFFNDLSAHYNHLLRVVEQDFPRAGLNAGEGVVEPTFISPALGLRGRLDFLQTDGVQATGIELKSGKKSQGYIVDTHRVQLSLYQLMLHYALGVERPDFFALYSRYPQDNLVRNHLSPALMQAALSVRNRIVLEEKAYAEGRQQPLKALHDAFTHAAYTHPTHPLVRYVEAGLQSAASALRSFAGDATARCYYDRFYRFLSRELYLSKAARAGGERPGATALWQLSTSEKRDAGCIIAPLVLVGNEAGSDSRLLRFACEPADEDAMPKFRNGDMVLVYAYRGEEQGAAHSILFRGVIVSLAPREVQVRLRDRERASSLFACGASYALEADYSDMAYRMQFAGLYAFMQAPEARRKLLLGSGDYRPRMSRHAATVYEYDSPEVQRIVADAAGDGELYLLLGPPGTGKTSVALMGMVREIMASPHRNLLLVAYTNRAVDEICARLEEAACDYLRIGIDDACAAAFRPRLMQNRLASCGRREEVLQVLASCRLYVASLVSLMAKPELFTVKHFDTAIVDEASQLLETQLVGLFAATDADGGLAIDRFVLIGDYKQLPAIVLQDAREARIEEPQLQACGLSDCRMSLFERLYRRYSAFPQLTGMLSRQWRMHPDIADFASQAFYKSHLRAGGASHQSRPLPYAPCEEMTAEERMLATTRFAFINVEPSGDTRHATNVAEADVVARVVAAYYRLQERNGRTFTPARSVGIITPYRNQIAAIRQRLNKLALPGSEDIRIDTVERFQGSQNDIIIFSCAVLSPEQLAFLSACHEEDGMLIDRKLNVAVTRAREQMVVVGYKALLQESPVYARLLQYISRRGMVL